MSRWSIGILSFFLVVIFTFSQSLPVVNQEILREISVGIAENPPLHKVSADLLTLRRQERLGLRLATTAASIPGVSFRDGLPEVEVRLESYSPSAVERLRSAGMLVTKIYEEYARIVGFCAPQFFDEVAEIQEVSTIHPNYRALLQSGSTTSQADGSVRAIQARSSFDVDGTGVRVGVISDSFHDLVTTGSATGTGCDRVGSGTDSQVSADLPASVWVLDNGPGAGTDEGRAMAELIHDLAPGADIFFHSGSPGESGIADAIASLRTCGVDVIVDDLINPIEPMFQDGIIAQEAQAAIASGVSYLSSAGNYGRFGVAQFYSDFNSASDDTSKFLPSGTDFHDFGDGDPFASVTVPPGCGIQFVLQWNEPFDGTLGPGASSDLDLYVYDSSLGFVNASTNIQGCGFGGNPFELTTYSNASGVPQTVNLAVGHVCGDESVEFRIVSFSVNCGFPGEYRINSPLVLTPVLSCALS